jgi:hypothetical protein
MPLCRLLVMRVNLQPVWSLVLRCAAALDSARFTTSSSDDSSNIWQHALVRQQLYQEMAAGLKQHGLILGGVVTQGLTQSQLFTHQAASSKWGRPRVEPVLHPLQVCSYHCCF